MLEALVRGLHLISVLAVFVGTLIVLPTGSSALDKTAISQLVKLYCLKLAALLVAMMSGLTLWLAIGKPAVFYSGNPVFHAKLGVFTLLTLLIVIQLIVTNQLGRQSGLPAKLPGWLGWLQKSALLTFLTLPPLAYLMARGLGYSG